MKRVLTAVLSLCLTATLWAENIIFQVTDSCELQTDKHLYRCDFRSDKVFRHMLKSLSSSESTTVQKLPVSIRFGFRFDCRAMMKVLANVRF